MQTIAQGLGAGAGAALTLDRVISARTIAQKGQQTTQGRRVSIEQSRHSTKSSIKNLNPVFGPLSQQLSPILPGLEQTPVGKCNLQENVGLPQELQNLANPNSQVQFPVLQPVQSLDNRELDKLVLSLGKNKMTWRRALLLFEWLLGTGHSVDDRLCTTLIRVCGQHGQVHEALRIYNKMKASRLEGGLGLNPTVYTYTAAMRAALNAHLFDKANQIWEDALSSKCVPDCRLCTTYMEVCSRMGNTQVALQLYEEMKAVPKSNALSPSVHAFTAAMRAAAEGGHWQKALEIWQDMETAGCQPTGHAYAAIISACKVGNQWKKALRLFYQMMDFGIQPDVVSCTALVDSLASVGQYQLASQVVDWMVDNRISPNVRTYTALMSAFATAEQWDSAIQLLEKMYHPKNKEVQGVKPNAYTFSALLKPLGQHGEWRIAELIFSHLEASELGIAVDPRLSQLLTNGSPSSPSHARGSPTTSLAEQLSMLTSGISALYVTPQATPSSQSPTTTSDLDDHVPKPRSYPAAGVDITSLKSLIIAAMDGKFDDVSVSTPLTGTPLSTQSTTLGLSSMLTTSGLGHSSSMTHKLPARADGLSDPALHALDTAYGAKPVSKRFGMGEASVTSRAAEILMNAMKSKSRDGRLLNELICSYLMLAYERAGQWQETVQVLVRAANLRITPSTGMFNIAISAAGTAGQLQTATQLFAMVTNPDSTTYEVMLESYSRAGHATAAETIFAALLQKGIYPSDVSIASLIHVYSHAGDVASATAVVTRVTNAGLNVSVVVYNELMRVYVKHQQMDQAQGLVKLMRLAGVEPDTVTWQLLDSCLPAVGGLGLWSSPGALLS